MYVEYKKLINQDLISLLDYVPQCVYITKNCLTRSPDINMDLITFCHFVVGGDAVTLKLHVVRGDMLCQSVLSPCMSDKHVQTC